MGLLDQVLGQVIGGLAGGSGQGGFGGGRAPAPSGGMTLPGGMNLPGGLGNVLSGNGGKIAMAVLALLASRHLQNGAGGYGSILHDMFAGGGQQSGGQPRGSGDVASQAGGGYSPAPTGGSGGFLDQIGGMMGGTSGQPAQQAGSTGGFGGSSGGLGGALGGGMLGSVLGSGLNDLMGRLHQSGHGEIADSWVGPGPNRGITPGDLAGALGADEVEKLSRQTGLDRDELLQGLSGSLPQIVDGLTPNGRAPTEDETTHWV